MLWNLKSSLTKTTKKQRQVELLQLLLRNRDIQDIENFLNPPFPTRQFVFDNLHNLDQAALDKAVKRIKEAITQNQEIIIYGDYDCDGVCASTILFEALKTLKANVSVFIPHRQEHGYGLSESGLREAIKGKKNPLIITVDNGITAHQVIETFQELDIIITDHHKKEDALPKAFAIVHTSLLSGSGVAWLLGCVLTTKLQPLDLVALATVCDLLPLTGVNRSLVKHGLLQMQKTARPGLLALYEVSGINKTELSTYHLGFVLGPRINAIGRLGAAIEAFNLLSAPSSAIAAPIANSLSSKNQDRQELTSDFSKIAFDHFSNQEKLSKVLFIADERFHEGIIGLIASKLVEKYYRPAIVVSLGSVAKASARSIPGFDITSFLQGLKESFTGLGGHHQAAGFSFQPENLKQIQEKIEKKSSNISDDLLVKKLDIDIELQPQDLDFDLLNSITQLEPFGVDNKEPIFSCTLPVSKTQLLGKDKAHLKVILKNPFQHLDVIGFNKAKYHEDVTNFDLNCAFTLQKNTFLNKTKLQLLIKDIQDQA